MQRLGQLASFGLLCLVLTDVQAAHVFGNPDVVQTVPARSYHVLDYTLRLHFAAPRGEVFGDESLTLTPLAAGFSRFYLDSSGLAIESVRLEVPGAAPRDLKFSAEDPHLWIDLDQAYAAGQTLTLRIVYHGFPHAGLFFVNPDATHPDAPREIWSQGEAEYNHYWFPCWDYPNDMSTSETVVTVPVGESVLSNGKLVQVTRAGDEVTYDWRESIPHSSYLTSIAVGPWRKFSDRYAGKPVDYYVPNTTDEATARRAFQFTPDMLGFFSRATGVDYPYEQYAQVAVHDYLFGGMENVSATTITDAILQDAREAADNPTQDVVSHEMGQHWFGDLVQGHGWGDMWLNEGFATYLEALYVQYHQGDDDFRYKMWGDQQAEQAQDRRDYRRPIVDYHYSDPMQVFDAITHQKAAVVLDMLRHVLDGPAAASRPASQDELLFKALHAYLTKYRAQATDTADLTDTVQSFTGQDLGWFFHEWLFMGGHPDYKVAARYDATAKREVLSVTQTQQVDAVTPLFDMPIDVAFNGAHGESRRVVIRDREHSQDFDIPLDFEPLWVDFDPDGVLDKTLDFPQPLPALIAKAESDPIMMSRSVAVDDLAHSQDPAATQALMQVLEKDAFFGVRVHAATALGGMHSADAKTALLAALHQPDNRVRVAVLQALGAYHPDAAVYAALVDVLHADASYAVQAAAAQAIGASGDARAFTVLKAAAANAHETDQRQGIFAGLVATHRPETLALLLSYAASDKPEQLRADALQAIDSAALTVQPQDKAPLAAAVGQALQDQAILTRMLGEDLAGSYGLSQFMPELEAQAKDAPIIYQRETVDGALQALKAAAKGVGQP